MQLALRRGYGYSFDPFRGMRGLGDDTTTLAIDPSGGFVGAPVGVVVSSDPIAPIDTGGGSLYSQLLAQGVGPSDACAYDPTGCDAANALIGMGPTPSTTPGVALTPAELTTEQSRATAWLNTIPGALTTASKIGLTAAQIAAGVQSGGLKPSSTCPSGYMIAGSAQCAVGSTAGTQWIPGVSNTNLAIAVAIIALFLVMGKKR